MKMLNIKKILGILLAVCFVLSVTAAAVSAAPRDGPRDGIQKYNNDGKNRFDNGHNGKNKYDNHDNKKNYGNQYGQKKYKHFKPGYWGYKNVRHHPDRYHKYFWFVRERCWFPSGWHWNWY
jgi:hypothetical protein